MQHAVLCCATTRRVSSIGWTSRSPLPSNEIASPVGNLSELGKKKLVTCQAAEAACCYRYYWDCQQPYSDSHRPFPILGTIIWIIGALVSIISILIRIINTLIRIIGPLIRIVGPLIRINGALIRILGTLIRIIGTLIRIIGTVNGRLHGADWSVNLDHGIGPRQFDVYPGIDRIAFSSACPRPTQDRPKAGSARLSRSSR